MLEDIQSMLLSQSTLAEEVVAQDADIGFWRAKFVGGKELGVRQTVGGGLRNLTAGIRDNPCPVVSATRTDLIGRSL